MITVICFQTCLFCCLSLFCIERFLLHETINGKLSLHVMVVITIWFQIGVFTSSRNIGIKGFTIGGSGRGGTPSRSKCFKFSCSFQQKNLQNNRLAHPLWKLAPPQENPGSASVYYVKTKKSSNKMLLPVRIELMTSAVLDRYSPF